MRLEIGTHLNYKDDGMNDGTFFIINNMVVKNGILDRVYCDILILGYYMPQEKKILARDLDQYKVVTILQPSKGE